MIWRTFLEPTRTGVDSYVSVSTNQYSCELKIADCNRTVNIGFYARDAASKKHLLIKIARLRKALDLVEANLIKQKTMD